MNTTNISSKKIELNTIEDAKRRGTRRGRDQGQC